jgi:Flp pilus assembly pilin Flp
MLRVTVGLTAWLRDLAFRSFTRLVHREEGQASAEYALVILAAAAVALVLLAWAKSSGKLPAFFDKVIDNLINSFS